MILRQRKMGDDKNYIYKVYERFYSTAVGYTEWTLIADKLTNLEAQRLMAQTSETQIRLTK